MECFIFECILHYIHEFIINHYKNIFLFRCEGIYSKKFYIIFALKIMFNIMTYFP